MILKIKNWAGFQHYKDRNPSWIKLHKSLLDDYEFQCLPIASKALAPMLWLLASEYPEGVIDATAEKIAFRLRMTVPEFLEALKPLITAGFVIEEQTASNPLAQRKQDSILEKRREEEKRGDSFTPLEAARGFLIEFHLSGEKFLRAAEQAISLRSQLAKVDAQSACDQLQIEYRLYLDSNPEFKKGPEKWLGECNQHISTAKPLRKWKVVGNG